RPLLLPSAGIPLRRASIRAAAGGPGTDRRRAGACRGHSAGGLDRRSDCAARAARCGLRAAARVLVSVLLRARDALDEPDGGARARGTVRRGHAPLRFPPPCPSLFPPPPPFPPRPP